MKRYLISLFAFFILSGVVWAESLDYRGIKLDTSKESVISTLNDRSLWAECTDHDPCCTTHEKIKNIDVQIRYCFDPDKKVLDHIYMTFDPDDYTNLRDALIEKYGKTKGIIKSLKQNRMGASFADESAIWTFKSGDIAISKYGSTIDSGYILFAGKGYNDRMKKRKKADKAAPGF